MASDDMRLFNGLGIALITIFLANWINDLQLGEGYDSLWVCHVSNLLLAAGLFLRKTVLMQIALLWILPGVVLWFIDSLNTYFSATSSFSHVGGLLIGLIAIHHTRAVKNVWYLALVYFLSLQVIARISTPPEANVNIAHGIWRGWQGMFGVYWQYWLFTTVTALVGLWLLEKLLLKLFPCNLVSEKGN